MQEHDLYTLFVKPLQDAEIPYIVAGSVGSIYYSEPRFTIDVDIPLLLKEHDIEKLKKFYPVSDYYLPPDEVMISEIKRECRAHFNIIHLDSGLKADIYPSGTDLSFVWTWKNRQLGDSGVIGKMNIAPPEYVILWKLLYYEEGGSEKHRRDIKSMLVHYPELKINGNFEDFIRQKGLQKFWEQALKD
ncbi:MAG: hypothetical protein AAGA64_00200 [Bacteroidota bacterium]